MADLEGPSFSLGLDLDNNLDSHHPLSPPPFTNPIIQHHYDETPIPGRILKRLRTRPRPNMTCNTTTANKPLSSHPYSGCKTSKLSLHKNKVLTRLSTSQCTMTPKEHATDDLASISMQANDHRFTFPKLIVSPLRNYELLDSDSESDSNFDSDSHFDDRHANDYANKEANKINSSSKAKLRNPSGNPTISGRKRANASDNLTQVHDLRDDFCMEKRFNLPTPALDEVCEEYFKSVKNNRTDPLSTNIGNCSREVKDQVQTRIDIDNDDVHRKLGDPVPPAHYYFYHDDPTVRKLVCSRLPYFFPLDSTNGRNQQAVPSAIDYMSQFNHGASSTPQGSHKTNSGTSSKRVKKISGKSNIEEVPEGSGGWVNPKSGVSIPADAEKRRVHAVGGQSAGHWFTSPEGKKVYVSITGQEFTGRVAYTHFKKGTGKGFKRQGAKKKGARKKKSFSKKKTAAKNR